MALGLEHVQAAAYNRRLERTGIPAADKSVQRSLKVYLVEDSPVLRDRVTESLEETGNNCVIGSAETEENAVNGILESAPDAVVVDIQLREGNGLNLLHRLRSLKLSVRPLLIVLTNYSIPEFRIRALNAGTDYFFDKATELHRVAEVLDAIGDTSIRN